MFVLMNRDVDDVSLGYVLDLESHRERVECNLVLVYHVDYCCCICHPVLFHSIEKKLFLAAAAVLAVVVVVGGGGGGVGVQSCHFHSHSHFHTA